MILLSGEKGIHHPVRLIAQWAIQMRKQGPDDEFSDFDS
jgi:hypothetical protein